MKRIFLVLLPIILAACYTAQQAKADKEKNQKIKNGFVKSHYLFTLQKPVENSDLIFNDSLINAIFSIGDNQINFSIENKTDHILKLIWDEASIGVFGKSHKIIHSGVKFIDKGTSSPASTILPNTRVDDLALPTDNVYYREGYYGTYFSSPGGWETSN